MGGHMGMHIGGTFSPPADLNSEQLTGHLLTNTAPLENNRHRKKEILARIGGHISLLTLPL